MGEFLDIIQLGEFLPILLLTGLLSFVGGQMVRVGSTVHLWSRRFGASGFIGYGLAGLCVWPPHSAWEVLAIVLRALLFSGLVLSSSFVLMPAVDFLYQNTAGDMLRRGRRRREQRDYERLRQHEDELAARREREKQERLAFERANQPPPVDPRAAAVNEFNAAIEAAQQIHDEEMRDELIGAAEIRLRQRTGGLS